MARYIKRGVSGIETTRKGSSKRGAAVKNVLRYIGVYFSKPIWSFICGFIVLPDGGSWPSGSLYPSNPIHTVVAGGYYLNAA